MVGVEVCTSVNFPTFPKRRSWNLRESEHSKFEDARLKEDEMFDEFYTQLNGTVNSSFNLGEKIPKIRIVRKLMRSLL